MEREIADLRRRLTTNPHHSQTVEANGSDELSQCSEDISCPANGAVPNRGRPLSISVESQRLATSLTTPHRDRSIFSHDDNLWTLEDISLSRSRVARLFEQ